ncbi:immune-related, lectin-like receptor 3 isoform a [Danio rerio]|uniref:Immune-related lectin-like receptor 3 splice variant a n=1 Tax=Danio rerio TaxID=7955 RepID=Q24K32_DANRE|nr:immune-related, lectin-like receptor 3 isoform a [Danio rerio]AAY43090.1 immune-related lectin-like receptor 3 splice variant a [Danio rerio]|eukprot:NP_001035128.1 immune-related, lectin-like receptor 3 isoform a [Danio rerio]
MGSVYENSVFAFSTGHFSNYRESKREVNTAKWTKVLLIVFAVSLVFALGGLCAVRIQYVSVSAQLSAQETNGTIMSRQLDKLTANFTTVRDHLHINELLMKELTANYSRVKEQLSISEETVRKLSRFNQSSGCAICAIHWTHSGEKCYYFSTVKMNWTQSRDHCVTKGGHLMIITSQAEQEFLTSNVKETHWIGLNDLDTEGRWLWVDNQPLSQTEEFWMKRENGVSEPDNWTKQHVDGEDCASLGHPDGETDFWTDAYCFEEKRFVCEAAAAV